jgi:tetratricopeptide (TPR) repeat protein
MGYELIAPEERIVPLTPALKDPVRAVRMEAARLLADSPTSRLSAEDSAALSQAVAEYVAAQKRNADRPESYLNLGNLYASRGEMLAAETSYRTALQRDPGFPPAYANLADLKASEGSLVDAEEILRDGLGRVPDSASLHHALGLVLIRDKRKDEGLAELRYAMELDPSVPRYAYVYGVACYDLQSPAAGITHLESALRRFPNDRDLLLGLAGYARNDGDEAAESRYLERLRSIEQVGDR